MTTDRRQEYEALNKLCLIREHLDGLKRDFAELRRDTRKIRDDLSELRARMAIFEELFMMEERLTRLTTAAAVVLGTTAVCLVIALT